MKLAIVCLAILLVLVVNEWWWRDRGHGEVSRKVIHMVVGSFVAFWPLFLSWRQIELLSLAFIGVVLLSRQKNIFPAIHNVDRQTWGELYFAAAVGLVALLTRHPAVYTVAILHMSLADGLAAIVGERHGHKLKTYKVFGARKSVYGTLAFFVVSDLLVTAFALHAQMGWEWQLAAAVVGATVLENVAIRGLDNLLVPLFVVLLLNGLV
jgi:phytol kinase